MWCLRVTLPTYGDNVCLANVMAAALLMLLLTLLTPLNHLLVLEANAEQSVVTIDGVLNVARSLQSLMGVYKSPKPRSFTQIVIKASSHQHTLWAHANDDILSTLHTVPCTKFI